jgi:hypothetical protein
MRIGLLALLLTVVGCAEPNTTLLTGTVTVDGAPIQKGAITFTPADGEGFTAGSPIKNGEYSARVPATTLNVTVSMPRVVGMKKIYDTPNSPERPLYEEGLPARYNSKSELQIEVEAGAVRKDFELQGQ